MPFRYIENNLIKNEKILYAVRPHWVVFSSCIWMVIFAWYLRYYLVGTPFDIVIYQKYTAVNILTLAMLIVGVYWFIKAFIYYKNAEYGVTNKRVLVKVGWIQRASLELILDKVEGVSVDQSIMGRLLGYGVITIIGTGGTKDSYPFIPDPLVFRTQVQQAVENFEESFKVKP